MNRSTRGIFYTTRRTFRLTRGIFGANRGSVDANRGSIYATRGFGPSSRRAPGSPGGADETNRGRLPVVNPKS